MMGMNGVSVSLDGLHQKYFRILRAFPDLNQSDSEFSQLIDDMSSLIEELEIQSCMARQYREKLEQKTLEVEELKQKIVDIRKTHDEVIDQMSEDLYSQISKLTKEKEIVLQDKKYLQLQLSELKENVKEKDEENKKLENSFRCFRERTERSKNFYRITPPSNEKSSEKKSPVLQFGRLVFDETMEDDIMLGSTDCESHTSEDVLEKETDHIDDLVKELESQKRSFEEIIYRLERENLKLRTELEEKSSSETFSSGDSLWAELALEHSNAITNSSFLRRTLSRCGLSSSFQNPKSSNDSENSFGRFRKGSFGFRWSEILGIVLLFFLFDVIFFCFYGFHIVSFKSNKLLRAVF